MSPKAKAIISLVVGILAGGGYVAQDLAGAGFGSAAKIALAIVALASFIQAHALPALFGSSGSASGGGPVPGSGIAASMLGVCLLCVGLQTACIAAAPIVPVTPDNQAQVSTCESLAAQHNGFVVGDFVIGAAATPALASVAAALPASDSQAKTDLAVAAAVAGGIAVAGAGYAAVTGSQFANSNCSSVVGALPPAPVASKVQK